MAEINNSLALGVKPAEFDIGNTLLKAGQINYLRANTAKTQQDVDYNLHLQDQNPLGNRPQEVNTLADASQKHADLRGRAANEIYNDPSDAGVQLAFKHFEDNGTPLDSLTKQKIMAMPPAQRQQTALNIRNGAMPSSTNMEATGETTSNQGRFVPQGIPPNEPIINRTQAAGGSQGFVTNNPAARNAATGGLPSTNAPNAPPVSGRAPPVVQMTDRIVPNSDGSLPSVPKQPAAPSFNDRFKGSSDMFTPSVVKGPDGSISSG
jgi:hypothetical protein